MSDTRRGRRVTTGMSLAGLVLLAVAGCSNTDDERADQATRRACSTLFELARDYSEGVTTALDLPDQLAELVRDARGAEPARLHELAVEALAQARAGDPDGLAASVGAMNEVCNE